MVSARPRRMSEIPDPPQPILPIPEGSAFFILSQNSRCEITIKTCDQFNHQKTTLIQTHMHTQSKQQQKTSHTIPPIPQFILPYSHHFDRY